ncbi:sulfotransferase [Corallibacter sp.]|uniref:sulfotransferase n=1 Tax=Corallibacter sp. TaxID=2038084 RepID=UPI003AB5D299
MSVDYKNKIKPNFLIVGAAKAGTTSLAKYLDEHPDIFISKIKEPRFLIANTIKKTSKSDPSHNHLISTSVLNEDNYFSLFEKRTEKAIGEASVHYLYHNKEAIENTIKYLGPETKIIILLRDPVKRAVSNWKYQDKDFLYFREALKEEESRKREGFNSFWYYKELGFYFNQVQAYYENFKNVKVILFEDFVKNTSSIMNSLYEFLDVDTNFTNREFIKHNDSSLSIMPKSEYLKKLLNTQKKVNTFKKLINKKIIPKRLYLKKKELIYDQDIDFLKNIYKEDINKLQKLINQDLSNWL